VLSTGLSLAGRVLGEHGSPLAGWGVSIQSIHEGAAGPIHDFHHDWERTDGEGRFTFVNLSERPYEIEVRAEGASTSSVSLRGVRPSGEELVLRVANDRVPSVIVAGRVVGRDGLPPPDVKLSVVTKIAGGIPIEYPDIETGEFETLPAGSR
jgi:hypothetical protein